jgi:cell division protein FtsZ
MADLVLHSGVSCITDLMVKEGLINLDFADVRSIMRGMGKAMMGTGEATGENRANLAAEAAIANPLLDEVSMKGARGLLISITGGHDLTLYEVDEAASRIRQEVDEDANIILGATFDSSLEGVVRVSVVATGIDLTAITADDPTSESRLAEAAERLRAQLQQARAQQAPAVESAPVLRHREEPQATAGYYSEPAPPHGIYLEPAPPRLAYGEPRYEAERHEAPAVAYVPPAPEQPRAPRMPQIEDFPQPIQEQLRQQMGAGDPRRKSIFERLASFGASRQEDSMHGGPAAPAPRPQMAPTGQPSATHAEYGKRPAAPAPVGAGGHAALDSHGRRSLPPRPPEDDHLETPAFLRRQANP